MSDFAPQQLLWQDGRVGAIPFVGSLAAEIVGTIIPNQRIDQAAPESYV